MEDNFDVSGFVKDIIKTALKKDKKRIANKKYSEKNKHKLKEYQRQYCEKHKEKAKEYHKEYREKNKEKVKEYQEQYRDNNKQYQKNYHKQYYEINKELLIVNTKQYRDNNKEKIKQYRQTPKCKKSRRISKWKYQGIITDDYDALYNHYLKTAYCDACRVELTYDRHTTETTKVVDHDHSITDAPNFRNILCWKCNINRR